MNNKKYYQQGDVLLSKIDELPEGLVLEEHPRIKGKKNNELAYGEAHGHCHLLNDNEDQVEIFQAPKTKERYLRVLSPVALSHEEHSTQTIEEGLYKFGQIIEFDPFTQFIRPVID